MTQSSRHRSVNVERDLFDGRGLDDYISLPGRILRLRTLLQLITDGDERALTVTGPCGIGKSKDLVLLGSALSVSAKGHKRALKILGTAARPTSWRVVATTCSGVDFPEQVLRALGGGSVRDATRRRNVASIEDVEHLLSSGSSQPVLLIADELSRVLEDAHHRERNLAFLQDLAELVQRLKQRVVLLGALHRGLATYGSTAGLVDDLSWIKVQGRFRDVPMSLSYIDGLTLIAQSNERRKNVSSAARCVAQVLAKAQRGTQTELEQILECSSQFTPLASALLVSIARTGIGQNDRGLTGCRYDLTSNRNRSSLILSWEIWPWVTEHMGSALARSTLSHSWALASHCVERAAGLGVGPLRLAQTLALLHVFGALDGIYGSAGLLEHGNVGLSAAEIEVALAQLQDARIVVYRHYKEAYELYEGSDFRLDSALTAHPKFALEEMCLALTRLSVTAVAKEHYHRTGTLRWFDVVFVPFGDAAKELPSANNDGRLVVVLDDRPRSSPQANVGAGELRAQTSLLLDKELSRDIGEWLALEHVRQRHPAMLSDGVARREVSLRLQPLVESIRQDMEVTLCKCQWRVQGRTLTAKSLSELATQLANLGYAQSPRLVNELLNRRRPSPNAVAARRQLCSAMLSNKAQQHLGIEGFPPERSLYDCLLQQTGLHRAEGAGWTFGQPHGADPANLLPAWREIEQYLVRSRKGHEPLDRLLQLLAAPPFGLREGVAPIVVLASLIVHETRLAFYADGIYFPTLSDVWVETFLRAPASVSVRQLSGAQASHSFDDAIRSTARSLGGTSDDVNQGLKVVARFLHHLDPWTRRSQIPSEATRSWRDAFLDARDPIQLLEDDLPNLLVKRGLKIDSLASAIDELIAFIPGVLSELKRRLCRAFSVQALDTRGLQVVRARCAALATKLGDLRLQAFAQHLSTLEASDASVEALAGFLANKPLRTWVDRDWQQCLVEVDVLLGRLIDTEAYGQLRSASSPSVFIHTFGIDGARRVVAWAESGTQLTPDRSTELDSLLKRLRALATDELTAEIIAAKVAGALLTTHVDKGHARRSTVRTSK